MLNDQIRRMVNTHGEGRVLGRRLSFLFYLSKRVISCTEQQLQQAVRVATQHMPPPAECRSLRPGRCGLAAAHPLRLRRPVRLASNSCGRHA